MPSVRGRSPVIVVARQAATAQAFLPLIRDLDQRGTPRAVLAFDVAHRLLDGELAGCQRVESFDQARPLLEAAGRPGVVLTGTSEHARDDASFWDWARTLEVPSVAFVDSWVAYSQRFSSTPGRDLFDLLPDHIAVADDVIRQRLVEQGCDGGRIVVTGNPRWRDLVTHAVEGPARIPAAIASEAGEDYVLFAGEPFNAALWPDNELRTYGYTELAVLRRVGDALNRVGAARATRITLVIKPHPRFPDRPYADLVGAGAWAHVRLVVSHQPAPALVAHARAVVGMTSLLLFEAAVIGTPVLSVQPDRLRGSDITDGRAGIDVITLDSDIDARFATVYATATATPRPAQRQWADRAAGLLAFLDTLTV
jgi:hypothetical protein